MSDDEALSPEIRRVAIVVIVGAIMSILDTTIVNVALESLSRDLDAPLSTIQWVATGYLLSLATVIPLTGWAAERFGPRRVWMTAVGAFAVTSALCALAWSAESLIAFRVLQGLAGGMIMPIGMITLAQTAGPSRVGRVMSVIGVPMLLAPVLGPVLGGLIVTHLSWRWIFLVNLPIGVIGLVLAARLMPAGRSIGRGGEGAPSKLDWQGLLLLSPGLALLVFGLSEVSTHGGVTVGAAAADRRGLALVAAFVVRAWHSESPLVDVQLFRDRGLRRRGRDGVPRRRRAVRRAARAAALLPGGARRVGADRRPADGAAGRRRGARDEPRGAARRPHRRRARRHRRADHAHGRDDRLHAGRAGHVVLAARARRSSCAGSASASR